MNITSRLQDQVEQRIKNRGHRSFYRGKVSIVHGTSIQVHAFVQDTRRHEVRLAVDVEIEVDYFCSCPTFGRSFAPCEHVWATLLAAEQKGHLGAIDSSADLELIPYDIIDLLEEEEAGLLEGPDADAIESLEAEEGCGRSSPEKSPDSSIGQTSRGSSGGTSGGTPHGISRGVPDRILRLVRKMDDKRDAAYRWRDDFRELLRSEAAAGRYRKKPLQTTESQLIYVINLAETSPKRGLVLEIFKRARKQDGEWGLPRKFKTSAMHIEEISRREDRQIVELLLGFDDGNDWSYRYARYDETHRSFGLSDSLSDVLIPLLGKSGRFFIGRRGFPSVANSLIPIGLDDGPPWSFRMTCRRSKDRKSWALTGELSRNDETMDLETPIAMLPNGWLLGPSGAARFDHDRTFPWIRFFSEHKALKVPAGDADSMLQLFYRSTSPPPVAWPAELTPETVRTAPAPAAKISASEGDRRKYPRLRVEVEYHYGVEVIQPADPRDQIFTPEERKLLLRDREAETAAWSELEALGCTPAPQHMQTRAGPEQPFMELKPRFLPRVVDALLRKGWTVEAEGVLHRQAGKFSVSVRSGIDWFDLEGGVDFGGALATLPRLLEAVKRKKNRVLLDDGTYGILPEDWLKKYGFLLAAGTAQEEGIRYQPSQVLLLDALLAAEGEAHWDKAFDRAREALRDFDGVKPGKEPAGFRGTLRPYQQAGLGWIGFLQKFGFGGCLADDMGLGKTIQVLALLEARRRAGAGDGSPSLVVMPRSLIFNWLSEAGRFTPKLRVLDHTGPGREKEESRLREHDVVLTTYGTLRSDVLFLKEIEFDYVILDESQSIKNRASQTAKAARLLKGRHRLGLSGTPIENHVDELFSLFEFLNPGMLGASKAFQMLGPALGADGGEVAPKATAAPGDEEESAAASRRMLARIVRPFILRRTKEAVAVDLPDKMEQTLSCELNPEERKRYDEVRDHYRLALTGKLETVGLKRSKIQILEALLRLRQAACHPGLLDEKLRNRPSTKVDLLLDRLRELVGEGRKALVFSQFTSFLSIVRGRLDEENVTYEYLDGRTRKRGPKVERFQNDPDCPLFLISLKAGGLGLNLTAAESVFLLDPWWNPAVESQAIDRAHRIGQEKRVFAFRLIARDTVEEKVVALQEKKRRLADAIISADGNILRDLTREDLEFILS